MYPFFALSHLTSFLRLANKFAERGHKTSFFVPAKTQPKLAPHNHHPSLITFVPVDIRHVDGLPQGAEMTSDVQNSPVILKARDKSSKELVDTHLASFKPDYVLYDFAYWLPALARKHGAKCIYYSNSTLLPFAYTCFTARNLTPDSRFTDTELMDPPPGFPSAAIRLHAGEARSLARTCMQEVEKGMTAQKMIHLSQLESDAIGSKTCREMEGPFCDFLGKHIGKPVLLAGPMVLDPPAGELNARFDGWLKGFSKGSVVYCALGSECVLQKELFQELLLGLELTGKPFLAVLKLPKDCETMESALPEGFSERTKDRGIVHSGWVQQPMILQHPSVGCFVTHCGARSLSEAILSECQLVLFPQKIDQFINARMMSMELRVGIEIDKREDDSVFTRFDVCKAITTVMDVESGVGKEVRDNHSKWRELLSDKKLEESYITEFIRSLQRLLE